MFALGGNAVSPLDENQETMAHREAPKFRRRIAQALSSALVLVTLAGCAHAPGRSSQNPGPKDLRSLTIVEAGKISSSSATLGFADSDLYAKSPADMDRTLDLMQQTGVSTVRILLPWAYIEPAPGTFDWSVVDRMVDGALKHGLDVLGVLNSTPAWAAGPSLVPFSAAPNPGQFGDFAAAVASRYRGRISDYEVWNESNSIFYWTPAPDAAAYTALLKAAYPRIKAVDPAATVVAAGLAPVFSFGILTVNPAEYVKGMYAAGAKNNFDAMAYHPYLYSMKFSEGTGYPESPLTQVNGMHQVMADNGDGGKAIWCTEYGQPTSSVDEATQAEYIRDMITTWRTLPFAGPVYIYTTRDLNSSSSSDADTLGVYRTDWTPKPSQQVVQSLAHS